MKFVVSILAMSLLLLGCATSSNTPSAEPQTKFVSAVEGSLGNEKLISDVTAGLIEKANVPADAQILKLVIQQPVGAPGERVWREVWVVNPETDPVRFLITFTETGSGVSFNVREAPNIDVLEM